MSFKTLCDLAAIADLVKLTVLKINDTHFMAVIEPSIKLAEKYPQLSSPLQVTATADDLAEQVESALSSYCPTLQATLSNLAQIESELADAQRKAREKSSSKTAGKASSTTATTTAAKPGAPMAKLNTAPAEKPAPPDLFGVGSTATTVQAGAAGEDADLHSDDELEALED